MTVLLGLLKVERDEEKKTGMLFASRFVCELLPNTTSSARFWSIIFGSSVYCLTIK